MSDEITYLACPRMHQNVRVMHARHAVANRVAGMLMERGELVFSPISHGHLIGLERNWSWETWQRFDTAMLHRCARIKLIPISGWEISRGVRDELEIGKNLGVEIVHIDLNEFGIHYEFPYIIPGPSVPTSLFEKDPLRLL